MRPNHLLYRRMAYDYHKDEKSMTINEAEAEVVRYIFNRYVEGGRGKYYSKRIDGTGNKGKERDKRMARFYG